jgi:glycerol-3-phosphate cytidylyltransferase
MKTSLPQPTLSIGDILQRIEPLRKSGKTCVTTNGCFDLLHSGHIRYLHDAAMLGDILVVGINSDRSVSRLKGPARPVQKEHDRAFIVGSLKMVDYVFIFPEPDPCAFLERLKPDIHVKGGDYTPEKLPETSVVEKHGGRIAIVPFINGYSTTSLIKIILSK